MKNQKQPNMVSYLISIHDESLWFSFLYLLAAVLLSYFLNLGFFIILVLVHLTLDVAKHRIAGSSPAKSLFYAFREGIVDVAFIFIGLAMGLYTQVAIGIGATKALFSAQSLRFIRALPRITPGKHLVSSFTTLFVHFDKKRKPIALDRNFTTLEKFFLGVLLFFILAVLTTPLFIEITPDFLKIFFWTELVPRW